LRVLGLGDTLLVEGETGIAGFALCHIGPGSEAGSGFGYIKFAVARDGAAFEDLRKACEAYVLAQGQGCLRLGVNTARTGACEQVQAAGYRTVLTGIAMHRPNESGTCHPGAWVMDDWR
jgi:hypothetical protein